MNLEINNSKPLTIVSGDLRIEITRNVGKKPSSIGEVARLIAETKVDMTQAEVNKLAVIDALRQGVRTVSRISAETGISIPAARIAVQDLARVGKIKISGVVKMTKGRGRPSQLWEIAA